MRKKKQDHMRLYGVAAGILLIGGSAIQIKNKMFPEPLAPCSQRYAGTVIDFPQRKAAAAEPVSVRDIQTSLGFDEWGLVEHVTLTEPGAGAFPVILDVAIPMGASPAADNRRGGVSFTWKAGMPNGAIAACLSYGVFLPNGFDFQDGGMLPGLSGGDEPRGGKKGFGTRIMWRRGGTGDLLANAPGTGERGISLAPGAWGFPTGRWVMIEQEVRLNTPGLADGFLGIWTDGELRVELDEIGYRFEERQRIQGILGDVHYTTPAVADTTIRLSTFRLRWQ